MDNINKLNQLVEDIDKVMSLIKKLGEATPEDVNFLKEEIESTRDELKSRYNEPDTGETDPQKA